MPGVSPYSPKGYDANGGSPKDWYVVRGYLTNGGAPQLAQKVHIRNTSNNGWIEVWNARPTISVGAVTSATYSVSASQMTVSGTVEAQGFATSLVFYYRKSGTTAYTSITGSLTATFGAQNYSFNPTNLAESTTYEYIIQAINIGGTTTVSGTKATPINCTTGNSGFYISAETNTSISCGICGTFNRNVKTYSKTDCASYTVTTDGSCTEATCGCAVAGTNGWTNKETEYREVACTGSCNSQTQYRQVIEKSGCADVVATDWTNTGGCDDGWYRLIPIYGFQYNIMYNYLGDGVDWFALFNSGGFYPSNNIYGGCGSAGYRLWYLYRCSYGYTDNSRNGQYEYPTGICVTS